MCHVIVAGIVFSSMSLPAAKASAGNESEKKNYIIMAQGKNAYNEMCEEVEDSIVESEDYLEEERMVVAELTENQAEQLDKEKKLEVEEDFILTASSVQKDTNAKLKKAKTAAKKTSKKSGKKYNAKTDKKAKHKKSGIVIKKASKKQTLKKAENKSYVETNNNTENNVNTSVNTSADTVNNIFSAFASGFIKGQGENRKSFESIGNEPESEPENEQESEPEENLEPEWNLKAINADEIDETTDTQNEKVKVAVLDSGVDYIAGIDLAGSVNFVDEEEDILLLYQDLTGHGTSIASVIAADENEMVSGVNKNVELYSVKVLDENNSAPISRIIEGIYWCIENDIDIINMSFGSPKYSAALEKAVEDAYNANILMVAAAGNNESGIEYPAAYEKVMAVASTNEESEISSFSNTGEELDIAAPGEKIRVLGFFGFSGITHGTSISVPHVVGVASLLWEKDLTKSNDFIRDLIEYSAKNIENTDDCGLLDAGYALDVYDTFEDNYNEEQSKLEGYVRPNTEEAEVFDDLDEDNYVEGRWAAGKKKGVKGHLTLVSDGVSGKGLNSTQIGLLKAGALYPDDNENMDGGAEGKDGNPWFHGGWYYKYFDDGTANVNYIACYEFLTRIALNNGNASSFSNYKAIWGINKDTFDRMKEMFTKERVGGKKWSKALKSNGDDFSDTPENRKYFMWGIALHQLGDMFAHQTYRKSNKKPIKHNKESGAIEGSDDAGVVGSRYEAAKWATKQSINKLMSNSYGNGYDIKYALDKIMSMKNEHKEGWLFLKDKFYKYANDNGYGYSVFKKFTYELN